MSDEELRKQALQSIVRGSGNEQQDRSISAPPTQKYIAILKPDGTVAYYENKNYDPRNDAPAGPTTDDAKKALELERQQVERGQRERNRAQAGFYVTDTELEAIRRQRLADDRAERADARATTAQEQSNQLGRERLDLDRQNAARATEREIRADARLAAAEDRLARAEERNASAQERQLAVSERNAALAEQREARLEAQSQRQTQVQEDQTRLAQQQATRPQAAPEGQFIQRLDPTTGQYITEPNAAYRSKGVQALQTVYDTVARVQEMMAAGQMTPAEAQSYMDAIKRSYTAALQGTTPFEEAKQRDQATQDRAQLGRDLLTTRVSQSNQLAQGLFDGLLQAAGKITTGYDFAGVDPFGLAATYTDQRLGAPQLSAGAAALLQGLQGQTAVQGLNSSAPPTLPPRLGTPAPPTSAAALLAGVQAAAGPATPTNPPLPRGQGQPGFPWGGRYPLAPERRA